MKLLLDNNLSHRLCEPLSEFIETIHVKDLGFQKASDQEIWEYAKQNNLVIVTKDEDFNFLVKLYGSPPFVVWIKTGNKSTTQIRTILKKNIEEIIASIQANKASIIELYAE